MCRGRLGHSLPAPRSKSPHHEGAGFPLREMGILESALPSSCGVMREREKPQMEKEFGRVRQAIQKVL